MKTSHSESRTGPAKPRSRCPRLMVSAALLASWQLALAQSTFTQIHEGPHVEELGHSGFGSWADYDNDGYPDLSVERYGTGASICTLYCNNGDGTFSRMPTPPGLAATRLFRRYCDSDNDGYQDLYALIANDAYIGYGDGQWDFSLELLSNPGGAARRCRL